MADLLTLPQIQLFGNNGLPLVAGMVHFHEPGSLTNKSVYTDSEGNVAHPNPIILDSSGRFASAVFGTGLFRVVIKDASGNQIADIDNVPSVTVTAAINNQWVSGAGTPTYISATSFSRSGDTTLTDHPGRRIRATIAGGAVIYGDILTSVFTSLTTIVAVFDSGSLDTGLTTVDLSLLTVTNPALPSAGLTKRRVLEVDNVTYVVNPAESGLHIHCKGASGRVDLPSAALAKRGFDCLVYNSDATNDILVNLVNSGDTQNGVVDGTSTLRPGDQMLYFAEHDETGYINVKLLKAVNDYFLAGQQTAVIASASTLPLLNHSIVDVSGSVAITKITSTHNIVILQFLGTPTLTHDGDFIINRPAANIVAAAGDVATFMYHANSKYTLIGYRRASGKSLVQHARRLPDFVSADQTIGNGTLLTLAHGIGAIPSSWEGYLECQSADAGYPANRVLRLGDWNFDSNNESWNSGCAMSADATNIYVRFRNLANWAIPNEDTGAAATMTFANWKLIVKAWK